MKSRQFITLAVSTIVCALTCPAATLIIDGYGDRVLSEDTSTPQPSFELVDFDLGQNLHTPFFRSSKIGMDNTGREKSTRPWLTSGFITLDSSDFSSDSPLANAEIATIPPPDATECLTCKSTPEPQSPESAPARSHVVYTLVMTSFPRDAEGVYTNAIYFNRKKAHQPYAILMLREGLAAVEPLALH